VVEGAGAGDEKFIDRLALEQIDRDIFTGHCHSGAPLRAYGGQIAAQALMAAGHTVEQKDRFVHSLHCYFLRPGRTKDSITYLVDRPRDGKSFSTRIVRAVQHGETIFMMTTSFATIDAGPSHQFDRPEESPPSQLTEIDIPSAILSPGVTLEEWDYPSEFLIELHSADDSDASLPQVDGKYERTQWVRITQELPHDPLVQASALTYLSDMSMVRIAVAPHREVSGTLQRASIDHAVWFHGPINVNRWLLFTQDTTVAGGGHGLARGLFYDTEGRLIASVVQESLMRTKR
jgi:acyl-CoA thioesterase-2